MANEKSSESRLGEETVKALYEEAERLAGVQEAQGDQQLAEMIRATHRRMMVENPEDVLEQLRLIREESRRMEKLALVGMSYAAHQMIKTGKYNESSLAHRVGVTRLTIRSWLGK